MFDEIARKLYCISCNKRFDNISLDKRKRVTENNIKFVSRNNQMAAIGDPICSACIQRAKRAVKNSSNDTDYNNDSTLSLQNNLDNNADGNQFFEPIVCDLDENNLIDKNSSEMQLGYTMKTGRIPLNIQSTSGSHSKCCVCGMKSSYFKSHHFKTVSQEAIIDAFIKTLVLIPKGSRCCLAHIDENGFLRESSIAELSHDSEKSELKSSEIEKIIYDLRDRATSNSLFHKFSSVNTLPSNMCKCITGLEVAEFKELIESLDTMRNSTERSVTQAVAVYLYWLRTGLSQERIAIYLGIQHQSDISRYLQQVRDALSDKFVAKNLGAKHLKREEWLNHRSVIAKNLFDLGNDQLALIADGTYCYCQKSSNNNFQRKTYSEQKKRHLVKPMVICTTDGYIVDIFGPFEACLNDARILIDLFEKNGDLRQLVHARDVFLVDRGFYDCIEPLESKLECQFYMPSYIPKGDKQLTCYEANVTRYITKCRWVIEALNRFFKETFRALDEVNNKSLPHILQDFRIAAALVNKFFQRMTSDKDNGTEIATRMRDKCREENELQLEVKQKGLHKKSLFEEIKIEIFKDFPRLTEEEIKRFITLGSYQLKQSLGYIAEHMNSNKKFVVTQSKSLKLFDKPIIKVQLQSRHKNRTKYRTYVKYDQDLKGVESILGWYCECQNGSRTVGCCSHIAGLIYYLSNLIHKETIRKPADFLSAIYPYSNENEGNYYKECLIDYRIRFSTLRFIYA